MWVLFLFYQVAVWTLHTSLAWILLPPPVMYKGSRLVCIQDMTTVRHSHTSSACLWDPGPAHLLSVRPRRVPADSPAQKDVLERSMLSRLSSNIPHPTLIPPTQAHLPHHLLHPHHQVSDLPPDGRHSEDIDFLILMQPSWKARGSGGEERIVWQEEKEEAGGDKRRWRGGGGCLSVKQSLW